MWSSGGIGRHAGLKIPCRKKHEGSSPSSTMLFCLLVILLCTKMEVEDILLGIFEKAGSIDWMVVLKVLGISVGVFWLFVVLWVWLDARERMNNIIVRILCTLLVLCFNIIGLIIYLLIRPGQTKEECYYAELEKKYLLYQTSGLEDCPKCGALLYPEYIFCPCCGEEIQTKCTKCSTMVNKNLNYCPACGEELIKKEDIDISTPINRDFKFWKKSKNKKIEKSKNIEKKTIKVKKERKPFFSFVKPVLAFIAGIFKKIANVIVSAVTLIGRFIVSIFSGIAGLFSGLIKKISKSREDRKLRNETVLKTKSTKSSSKSSKRKTKQKKNRRKK